MTSVFISSTGKDLGEYRQAAIEICNRFGFVPIAMEFFEAMGVGATEGSKRRLNHADLYVGIFAHRYGFIEPGYDAAVTEIEFDYAGNLGLDRLCFLVAPDYPWPPDQIDFENYAKLTALKEKVSNSLIRSEFTTINELKVKLIQALNEWQKHRDAKTIDLDIAVSGLMPTVPPRPPLMIGREAVVRDIKTRLGVSIKATTEKLTIVRGWPGVGKTTLMASLAHEEDVRTAFPNGIIWITVGRQFDMRTQLTGFGRYIGVPAMRKSLNLETTIAQIRSFIYGKRMLLIADDVWKSDDISLLKQVLGPDCALVMTTRFNDVARNLADDPSDIYRLDILSEENAMHLFRRLAPTAIKKYPKYSRKVVRDLEGLPLAVRVAARLIQAETDLGVDPRPLMNELRENHKLLDEVAPDDRFDSSTGTTPSIRLILQRSTDRLDSQARECFGLLGVFAPKPATFDIEAMKYVWEVDDPLPIVRTLVDYGLLEPIPSIGRFQIHSLLVMHALELLAN